MAISHSSENLEPPKKKLKLDPLISTSIKNLDNSTIKNIVWFEELSDFDDFVKQINNLVPPQITLTLKNKNAAHYMLLNKNQVIH